MSAAPELKIARKPRAPKTQVKKLVRKAHKLRLEGKPLKEACKEAGVSPATYLRHAPKTAQAKPRKAKSELQRLIVNFEKAKAELQAYLKL